MHNVQMVSDLSPLVGAQFIAPAFLPKKGVDMPSYHRLGQIPPKRHTQFRKPDGTLYAEEVFGTEGFSGNYSILYYTYPPTRVTKVEKFRDVRPQEWDDGVQR